MAEAEIGSVAAADQPADLGHRRYHGDESARMLAYRASVDDPAWREAIGRNGWEEGRHKQVLSNLVSSYGIPLAPEPPDKLPADAEWGYLVTGYSECIDSFVAFGLFEVARRSGYFPAALVETFEPVIQEEARHILLFANWLAWHRRRLGLWRRIRFEFRVIRAWLFLALERVGLARDLDSGEKPAADNNFTLNGSKAVSDVGRGAKVGADYVTCTLVALSDLTTVAGFRHSAE